MKILFVGSEIMPFAATGGLGDVLGSLPQAIASADEKDDIRAVMPLYGSIGAEHRRKMKFIKAFEVTLSWRKLYCGVFSLKKNGVTYYFLDNEYYFKRDSLYGSFDDGERYAFFCAAVLRMMYEVDFYPDILHANDWQSALSVVYLNLKYRWIEPYSKIRTVFTIHNIQYQGQYDFAILGDVFDIEAKDRGYVDYGGCINLMKGAIELCDRVTTVSPTYAREILSPEYSFGLSELLRRHEGKLCGILNGIDYTYYDPKTDPTIASDYSWRALGKKTPNKTAFQKEHGLPTDEDIPLYCMISRLAGHKGFDLVKYMLEDFVANHKAQVAILGKGEEDYENYFRYLAEKYPDKVSALLVYDRALSKKLYAAADMFIMPSKSEPCGLSQMIASRYGAVPITRETGGLYDSIKGYYVDEHGKVCGNGFTFRNYNADELRDRMQAAYELYFDKTAWQKLVRKVMREDFSWEKSAEDYRNLYHTLA